MPPIHTVTPENSSLKFFYVKMHYFIAIFFYYEIKQMPFLDLHNDQYLFGRGLNSDYLFDMRRFDDSNYFKSLSSSHFKISKVSLFGVIQPELYSM